MPPQYAIQDELNRVEPDPAKKRLPPPTVVICVAGGVVQEVYADSPVPRVILMDWDTETSEEGPHLIRFLDANHKSMLAWVAELPTSQLPPANSDVSLALAAAGLRVESPSSTDGIRDPYSLSQELLAQFAQRVQAIFYLDIQHDREFWNPDKEWDAADLLDELAQAMQQYGLVPTRVSEAPI